MGKGKYCNVNYYLACIWYVYILIHRSECAASCYTQSYHHLFPFLLRKESLSVCSPLFPFGFHLGICREIFQMYLHPLLPHHSSHHSLGSNYQEDPKVQFQAPFLGGRDKDLFRSRHTHAISKRMGGKSNRHIVSGKKGKNKK